jgi:rhodanese-related sulfurtransferase
MSAPVRPRSPRRAETRRILGQALGIVLIPALLGLAVNAGLIVRFARGEFSHGFVAAAETESVVFISGDQARDLWENRTAQFIDARAPGLFAAGHIPYAVNIPLGETDKEGLIGRSSLDRAKPAVVYCDGASCLDSLHLAQWLSAHRAFTDIRVYSGGWQEWVDLGLPIEASRGQK